MLDQTGAVVGDPVRLGKQLFSGRIWPILDLADDLCLPDGTFN
jgi:hypothetical protein